MQRLLERTRPRGYAPSKQRPFALDLVARSAQNVFEPDALVAATERDHAAARAPALRSVRVHGRVRALRKRAVDLMLLVREAALLVLLELRRRRTVDDASKVQSAAGAFSCCGGPRADSARSHRSRRAGLGRTKLGDHCLGACPRAPRQPT